MCTLISYYSIIEFYRPNTPNTHIRSTRKSSFQKISVVHYTKMYYQRMDSSLNVFNNNLRRICKLIDPEEYPDADGVIVTSFDLVRLPSLLDQNNSYRNKYQSQLWLFHSEESPRNSYRAVQMKNISELDDWFNLTATLKPESDLHIQYKV